MIRIPSITRPLACALLCAPLSSMGAASGAPIDATSNWCTIDGGGGTSTGGSFAVSGTIGQPDAGIALNGGAFTVVGGFWPGAVVHKCQADVNGNNLVNIDDLVAVITSWGACPSPPASCPADVSPAGGDGQVNIDDLVVVITGWGPCS